MHHESGRMRFSKVLARTAIRLPAFYNSGMKLLQVPSGASDALAHAVAMADSDIDRLLAKLDTDGQNQFWIELKQFAVAETGHRGRAAPIIVGEGLPDSVRRALRDVDAKLARRLDALEEPDRERFWHILRQAAHQQAREPGKPKARTGGHTRS